MGNKIIILHIYVPISFNNEIFNIMVVLLRTKILSSFKWNNVTKNNITCNWLKRIPEDIGSRILLLIINLLGAQLQKLGARLKNIS